MFLTRLRALYRSTDGAVAPTVALSLVALIGIGGIAFDYSRMAGMHSELQNAADQAALAAATQLDGKDGAMDRATAAANGLVANLTLLSNDGEGNAVGIATVEFFEDQGTTVADEDDEARFVRVTVDGREVRYALTPIVGAISSGMLDAIAMAGLGSAVCKVPPLMICNPAEATDPNFNVADYVGKGIKLVSVGGKPIDNGEGAWAPGNFGYLNSGDDQHGANDLKKALGWTTVPGDCSPADGVDTKPGANTPVTDALNTRFDIYDNGNPCPGGNGNCPPSANSTKDLVRKNQCTLGGNGWAEAVVSYKPIGNKTLADLGQADPDAMGYAQDICHASNGICAGKAAGSRIGDGIWDIDAYFRVNYAGIGHGAWMTATGLPANATRYEVYKWEMEQPSGTNLNGVSVLGTRAVGSLEARGKPFCQTPGITPGGTTPDRRRLSVAVVNCGPTYENVHGGSENVKVTKWIDIFLTEPSLKRTRTYQTGSDANDVYVEVIGEAGVGDDGTAGQVVQRNVPYLVK